ncbi:MAG: AAA family ATPase [Candidatus Caldarchaeum sp.]|nr:AAA family ATPase [Candidatus Caldarchaeum sp.]
MPIFVDKTKLSSAYLPKRMLHRDREKQLLTSILLSGINRSNDFYVAKARVVGGVGVGKTTLCIMVGQEVERTNKSVKHLYLNLRRFSTSKVTIYRHIVRSIAPDAYSPSLSAEELLDNLLLHLKNTGQRLLITFDDADYHVSARKGRESILYDFVRLHEISSIRPLNVVGVIFVFRDDDHGRFLEKSELSSLGASIVRLPDYTKQQLFDILNDRVAEAFQMGAVPISVVDYVAGVVSAPPYNGDVRFALDLLLHAGNIAESSGLDSVRIDDVRRVISEIYPSISSSELAEMSEEMRAAFLAVAKTLLSFDEASADIKKVKKTYEMICDLYGLSSSGFENALKQLVLLGYVRSVGDGRLEILRVDAGRLVEVLEPMLRTR